MKIILATDGSKYSDAAVEECCRIICRTEDTQVKVVSTYQEVVPLDNFAQSVDHARELERKEKERSERFADLAAAFIDERFPDSRIQVTRQIAAGAPDRELIETAESWNADLIVIGSHGRGFWERMLVGSVTDAVVHHAPCSVLVVRKK